MGEKSAMSVYIKGTDLDKGDQSRLLGERTLESER